MSAGIVTEANPAAEAFFGYPVAELFGRRASDLLDGASLSALIEAERNGPGRILLPSTTITQRSGATHSVQVKARRFAKGATWRCQFFEPGLRGLGAELRRQNWALSAYARSSSALTRFRGAHDLMARICDAIVEQPAYVLACVGLLREDGWLNFVASAGPAAAYLEGLRLTVSDEVPEGMGASGRALRSGVPNLIRDTMTDPVFAAWREKGRRHELRSTVTVAVRKGDDVVGALLVYAREPDAFGPKELNLFCQLADDIALALTTEEERRRLDEIEQARRRAEDNAREAQAELLRVARISFMGEFAAALAHEINQPLAACELNAEASLRWLARDPAELGEARAALTRIVRDSRRANDIIKRTRAIYVSGETSFAAFDLNEATEEILVVTADRRRKTGVILDFRPGPLPMVWGDRIQIQQIVFNLVYNALDELECLDSASRRLTVTTEVFDSHEALLEVRDNGRGFDAEMATRVFDRFFTTKAGGAGLGLAISRRIAESHGGRLWAVSDEGARFRLTLPFARDAT